MNLPLQYVPPLFRPPSEAASLIFQVTIGCSWNRCAFCEMYRVKQYAQRPLDDILREIRSCGILCAQNNARLRKIFLADGDALALPTDTLLAILRQIGQSFPHQPRVSSYALPRNINKKSTSELGALRAAGLSLVYLGIESGCDEVLRLVQKGETAKSTITALQKAKVCGIKSSVMILNGLGGIGLSEKHAVESALVLNETQPEYASTLVLYFPMGPERLRSSFPDFSLPGQHALFREMEILLENLQLDSTIFRSDHASNYLILKGVLNKDRDKLLEQVRTAIHSPEKTNLQNEWMRGL